MDPKPHGLRNYTIKFTDANNIMIFGEDILKSADWGINWEITRSEWLFSTTFVNDQVGWGGGEGIYKTTDGGATWSTQSTGYNDNLTDAYFLNPNKGFVGSIDGYVYFTTDGGYTLYANDLSSVAFRFFQDMSFRFAYPCILICTGCGILTAADFFMRL